MNNEFEVRPEEQNNAAPESVSEEAVSAEQTSQQKTQTNAETQYANTWSAADKKKRTRKKVIAFIIVAAVLLTFSGCSLLGIVLLKDIKYFDLSYWEEIIYGDEFPFEEGENDPYVSNEDSGNVTPAPDTENPDLNFNITDYDKVSTTYTELYEKCSVSCVSVVSSYENGTYSLGSGIVLSKDGYISTNHHVIEDAESIRVIFYDGTEYEAKLIGSDSLTDLAVLRIEADNLIPAELGNSDTVSVGETVVAIGSPYDLSLAGTMTVGVISGLEREVECTDDTGSIVKTMTLLQTDASINPGNSGGPLFNINGQVIGINTLKLMDVYEGIGFSIPISAAIRVFEDLVEYGKVMDYEDIGLVKSSPKLHITVIAVSDARETLEFGKYISKDAPDGVYVVEVTPGTAIYEAGLEIYDIITKFNGIRVENTAELANALSNCAAGETVSVEVYHRGQYKTLTFKLDSAA